MNITSSCKNTSLTAKTNSDIRENHLPNLRKVLNSHTNIQSKQTNNISDKSKPAVKKQISQSEKEVTHSNTSNELAVIAYVKSAIMDSVNEAVAQYKQDLDALLADNSFYKSSLLEDYHHKTTKNLIAAMLDSLGPIVNVDSGLEKEFKYLVNCGVEKLKQLLKSQHEEIYLRKNEINGKNKTKLIKDISTQIIAEIEKKIDEIDNAECDNEIDKINKKISFLNKEFNEEKISFSFAKRNAILRSKGKKKLDMYPGISAEAQAKRVEYLEDFVELKNNILNANKK